MAEPIDLTDFHDRGLAFLSELAANNDRDWFRAQKARYDAELKRPAERLLADLAPVLEHWGGAPVRTKLFRPHRDVRFTEDKTPYHTHLHLLWSHVDGRAWFFGLSPDYATAGAGIMQMPPQALARYHDAVAGPAGADLARILPAGGWRLEPRPMARVPQPFPPDHPRADLLRRKGLVAWEDGLHDALRDDPRGALHQAFEALSHVQAWLGANL